MSKGLSEEEEREWAVKAACQEFHHFRPCLSGVGPGQVPLTLSFKPLTCNIPIVTQTHPGYCGAYPHLAP